MNFTTWAGFLTPATIGRLPANPGGVVPGAIGSCDAASDVPVVSRWYWKLRPEAPTVIAAPYPRSAPTQGTARALAARGVDSTAFRLPNACSSVFWGRPA